MTTDISKILQNRGFETPPEIQVIKDFILKKFDSPSEVSISTKNIIIIVDNSALAGALRQDLGQLQKKLNIDKQLIIRIQ